jgi:hypothetical protein
MGVVRLAEPAPVHVKTKKKEVLIINSTQIKDKLVSLHPK